MEILRVEHVGLTYQAKNGEVSAFEDISFAVEEGEFLSIVGPSGCGKSTLLSVIAGLLPATRGEVYVKGERVRRTSAAYVYAAARQPAGMAHHSFQRAVWAGDTRHQNAADGGAGKAPAGDVRAFRLCR